MFDLSLFSVFICILTVEYTKSIEETCESQNECSEGLNKYSQEVNEWTSKITKEINTAVEEYEPCKKANCSCHTAVIVQDLAPFKNGISKELFELAVVKGTKYQIIDGKLYREKDCHFPARCAGIEHYLSALGTKMPDMELAINTRDWPQVNRLWGHKLAPVFSFSKTKDHYDIMYPTWSFWEGGPAISLYPTGIGRWDKHRLSISAAAQKWPWDKKEGKAFFRGSRTSEERDALILLSRAEPDLVDAQYTKNQAWKSDADTLYAPPASEVSFEEHCRYKYLFNYRGVAASFRLKHLFLCKSLVFHVGDQWLEFFYPSLKPWVHYVPISPKAKQDDIKKYIEYFKVNDSLAKEIAERGFQHIWDNLTDKDVRCYWRKLLKNYFKLIKYDVKRDEALIKDTLYAPPASEVSFEEHCRYKYLFNYRGVAASFRLKHLFLCKSLVFHVGDQWLEFFYPSLKPWVHYVPISPKAKQDDIKKYIEYFKVNDSLAKEIAERGFQHIWDNLTDKDVRCYWRKLLKNYFKLIKYDVKRDEALIKV